MTDLNLKDEQNRQLINLISDEDIETIEEEVEFQIFKLVKKLKQMKTNEKSIVLSKTELKPDVPETESRIPETKDLTIEFHDNFIRSSATFSLVINTGCSVTQLIEQVQDKRKVIINIFWDLILFIRITTIHILKKGKVYHQIN